jgi:hypothetical protein
MKNECRLAEGIAAGFPINAVPVAHIEHAGLVGVDGWVQIGHVVPDFSKAELSAMASVRDNLLPFSGKALAAGSWGSFLRSPPKSLPTHSAHIAPLWRRRSQYRYRQSDIDQSHPLLIY